MSPWDPSPLPAAVVAGPWLPRQPADAGTSPSGTTRCGVSSSVLRPHGLLWSLLARLLGLGGRGLTRGGQLLLPPWASYVDGSGQSRAAVTKCRRSRGLKQQLFIFLSSGGGTPRARCGQGGLLLRVLSSASRRPPSPHVLMQPSCRHIPGVSPLLTNTSFCWLRVHSYDLI